MPGNAASADWERSALVSAEPWREDVVLLIAFMAQSFGPRARDQMRDRGFSRYSFRLDRVNGLARPSSPVQPVDLPQRACYRIKRREAGVFLTTSRPMNRPQRPQCDPSKLGIPVIECGKQ
jgi:hypothetical protein